MPKNYMSAKAWHDARTAMKNRGENATPPIKNVRTQCWSVTISLKPDSGNTLETVTELFKQLAQDDSFSGCFSEEEGKAKDDKGNRYRHCQCAVYWTKQKTGSWLLEAFKGTKAHIEPAKNTQALIRYVQKEDTHISGPYKHGHWEDLEDRFLNSKQGQRRDLEQIEEAITTGMTFTEMMNDPNLNKTLDRHKTWAVDRLNALKCGKWQYENRSLIDEHGMLLSCDYIYGSSGLGKTGVIQSFYGLKNCFIVSEYDKGRFVLDGYSGEQILILDEFKSSIPFKKLLKWMQGYPYSAEVKGGSVWAGWQKVVIISSVSPLKMYRGLDSEDGEIKQFWRRLSEGVVVNADTQPLGHFYPYDNVHDALRGITKYPKGIKGYGPEYWEKKRQNLPEKMTYEYADVSEGITAYDLNEIGYKPDNNDEDEDW